MKKKTVIFGAGEYGQMFFSTHAKDYEVLAFIDNDVRKHGSFINGLPVHGPDHILTSGAELVLVTSCFSKEIVEQLTCKIGLPENMVQIVGIDSTKSSLAPAECESLRAELKRLTRAFKQAGIPCWLDHSSLLHLLRSGEFINGFDDVDLCLIDSDAPKALEVIRHLFTEDVIHVQLLDEKKASKYWKLGDFSRVKIGKDLDIQIKHQHGESVFWDVGPFILQAPISFYQAAESRNYFDFELSLPLTPESYLDHLYGPWRKPQPNWTYADYNNIIDRFPYFS